MIKHYFKGENTMKKMFALVLALVLCLGATAMAETVLQLGTTVNEQDSFQVAAEKFAELVEERTNGLALDSKASEPTLDEEFAITEDAPSAK